MEPVTLRISVAALSRLEEVGLILSIGIAVVGLLFALDRLWRRHKAEKRQKAAERRKQLKLDIVRCLGNLKPTQVASVASIAEALKRKPSEVEAALTELLSDKRIRLHPDNLWSL